MELGFEETIGCIYPGHSGKEEGLQKRGKGSRGVEERPRVTEEECGEALFDQQEDQRRATWLCLKMEKGSHNTGGGHKGGEGVQAPAQENQGYIVIPPKLRLVEFNGKLKRALVRQSACPKIIVFSPIGLFRYWAISTYPEPMKPARALKTTLQIPMLPRSNQSPPKGKQNSHHQTILQSPKPQITNPPPSSTNSQAPSPSHSEPLLSTYLHMQHLPRSSSEPTQLPVD